MVDKKDSLDNSDQEILQPLKDALSEQEVEDALDQHLQPLLLLLDHQLQPPDQERLAAPAQESAARNCGLFYNCVLLCGLDEHEVEKDVTAKRSHCKLYDIIIGFCCVSLATSSPGSWGPARTGMARYEMENFTWKY